MIIFKNSPGFAGLFMATLYGGTLRFIQFDVRRRIDKIMLLTLLLLSRTTPDGVRVFVVIYV